jgi:hypothetical protein
MDTLERRGSPVFRQVEAYEEAWKEDHGAAAMDWIWDDTVAVGVSTGLLLERVDRAWRERVFHGTEQYAEEANQAYRVLFATWLRVTDAVLARLRLLPNSSASLEGTQELRQLADRLHGHLAHWEAPRLSLAVGLREMTLTPEAAAELTRLLQEEASPLPAAPPMQALSAEEFWRRFPKRGQ